MGGGGGGGGFGNTKGGRVKLKANTKFDALSSVKNLSETIQKSVKNFFKGGSNKYNSFSVEEKSNGNTILRMEKPGNVTGSKAIYYKEIDLLGNTIKVYKETYGPDGNLIHTKIK